MYYPNCEFCKHRQECYVVNELKEARETIWNINREMSGRKDFIFNGKLIPAEESEK